MDNNLQNMIANLETAVRIMMDPGTVQQLRLQAYQTCEDFKENSNQCAQCGVIMSGKDHDPITRHFGLQLIEHCVKFRWNKMTIEEKKFLKESTLKIISEGTLGLLEEQLYIKDALSRIVVEMAKREWPQQWPSMLSELDSIYSLGPTQTELVLLIFLRLAEDILIFQSAPAQRRRDITQGLTNVMQQLFPWFINTLESNVTAYKHALYQTDERTQMFNVTSSRVAVAAVETITAFIDWINISHIIDQDGRLLRLLCAMLDDVNLRLSAVECLLAITSRKGKLEDRQPILILFSTEAMSIILNAAIMAATAELDEQNYVFLKRLCQVLTALGSQLSTLWGSAKDVGQPVTFHQYLEGLLAFTDHSSLMLCGYTLPLWSSFLKHEHISKDPILLNFIPRLVTSAASTLVKAGFPSQNNSPRCRYSRLDFDCDEDFFTFFSRLRADCADMLRWAAAICPEMMFRFVASRIEEQLKKPLDLGEGCDHGHCNLSSPSFLEWDALTVFLESVMSRFPTPEKDTPLYNDGLLLFNTVLSYDTMFWENGFKDLTLQTVVSKPLDDISTGCLKHRDPLIRSAVLSVISALFPFIVHSPNILTVVLDKIFTTAVFSLPGQTKATRSRAVKNVRRHACSVLVKICKLYPNLLLPGFDELYRHIQHLSSNPDELSQMEKCTLMEALILISNQNKNYEKQMRFLSEIVDPLKVVWLSDEVKEALWSVDKFIKFVGLDQSPVEPSISDVCGISRSQLAYCIVSILAVLKRSQCPEVTEEAAAGGFMATSESGVSYVRNPATPVLMGLIDNVLRLCRTVNELYLAENLAKRHPGFSRSYDILDIDKLMFLGVQPHLTDNTNNSTCKQPLDRMQSFMTLLHENCFHILGNIGRMVGYEFYRLPNLASSLLNSLCMHLEALPDYRLRAFIRSFLKPFVFWCPKEFYSSAVLPILARIGKHFHERLLSKWEVINQKCEESSGDEENSESQELLEELIVRHLTREYLDFLGVVFREKKGSTLEVGDEMVTDDSEASKKAPREEKIGDLGLLVLQDSAIFPSMVHTVFVTLSWNDTITCMKALNWCVPILKQMLVPPVRLSSEDAMYLLGAVIMGLNMHGQHEGAQSILLHTALQVYELLIPDFRGITDVMLQISSCSANNLKKFTDMITMSANPQQRVSDKKKKEMFKSLVLDAIGKNIGQQFKKEVNIRNLAPFQTHRPKMARLDEVETCDIGLCALFMKEADDLS